jgi:hydrophobic/amphiphilic exporter-1 (mainly G- bacteria), HAE1 family
MIRYFAGHRTAANLLMALILILGISSFDSLKRETFPDIPPDEIQINMVYPGASAEDVEEALCRRIETAVENVTDAGETRCESRQGMATAVVEMREGGSFDGLLADIKTEVDAIDDFPMDTESPVVRQLGRTDFVGAIALAGPMGVSDLKAYGEILKTRLQRIHGVSGVTLKGFSDHQIRIELRTQTLRRFGLSVADISKVVGRQSVERPAGTVEGADREVLLRFDDARRSPAEFARLVVVGDESGATLRLGEIAHITDRFENPEELIRFNGQRAAILEIRKGKSADTLDVIGDVRAFVDEERARAPAGIEVAITQDISSIVSDRLNMLTRNGATGLVLVLVTLSLFFSLRFSFWVAMGLPVSFAGALFFMAQFGLSIDMISMVALLIAIGILVDDAIVIAENIAAHRHMGKQRLAAVVDGAREVAPGVLASFATTVFVFGPLAFLSGDIGSILKVLPVVLILTLVFSLVEAFMILPNHLSHSLSNEPSLGDGLRARVNEFAEWLRDRVVGPVVDAAVEWRYLTVGVAIMILLLSVSMIAGGTLKFRAFPDLDGDVIEARILMPQGTPLARTEAVVERITQALDRIDKELTPRQPGKQKLVRNVAIHFSKNIDAFETGPHVATVSVDLLNAETRATKLDDILASWRAETGSPPGVISLKFTDFTIGPAGRAFDIRLQGDDLERLGAASRDMKAWLSAYKGALDITDDLRPGMPEVRIALRERALALGLEAEAVAAQLRAAFFGQTAAEVQIGPESYEIDVRLDARDKTNLSALENFAVTAPDGGAVPLGAIATLNRSRGYSRINRIDGVKSITIQGDVDSEVANASAIIADMRARFLPGLVKKYPGVSIDFEGQEKESGDTTGSMRSGFLLGLVGVFLLLCFMFRSYVEPIVVMVSIPMALIGVIWGHLAMGLDLSMPSMMGFVSLAGVVVNNAILLVIFIKLAAADGDAIHDAARGAARKRFRAVLLTSLTTVMGMLPMLTETSLQAQVLKPLITSLVFGLASSTVMILFLVPALYCILNDFGLIRSDTDAALQPSGSPGIVQA